MTTAKETAEKVKKSRKGLDVKMPETTGQMTTTEPVVSATVVNQNQQLPTDVYVEPVAAIAQNLTGIYNAANTALENANNAATQTFAIVSERLNQILAPGVTVSQLRDTIGGLTWEERNAQLAVLEEIENAQAVELKKLDVQEVQVGIELKRIAIQLKAAKGFIKNAITVEEIKDLENELSSVQQESFLKQDGRNIQLSFIAGKNAVEKQRVTSRLDFLASVHNKTTGDENDRLDHKDAISALNRRLYAATQKGYESYVNGKELKAQAKVSLVERMKSTAGGNKNNG